MNKKNYNIITINLVNIILTVFLLALVYIFDNYLFTGFLPRVGYFIIGYGLGYLLPPIYWVTSSYYEKILETGRDIASKSN